MNVVLHKGEFVNKGAEAMVLTTQDELSKRLPDHFTFEVIEGRGYTDAYREHVEQIGARLGALPEQSRMERIAMLLLQILRRPKWSATWLRDRRVAHLAPALAERADAILDISGFAYADKWGTGRAALMNALVHHMRRRGKPYVFLPQCWGPFENRKLHELCSNALPEAQLLYTRDERSQKFVADLLNRPQQEVALAPDIAFLFEPGSKENAHDQLRAHGLSPEERPLVGIAPNMRVYDRTSGEGASNTYLQALVNLCHTCMEEQQADVALIPHEININKENPEDDRMLCQILEETVRAKAAEGPSSIAALNDETAARSVKALIGECDLLVGSRFHSLVAALSQGVPPVAIGWAHKYPQLLGLFGLERFSIRYQDLSGDKLLGLFEEAWDERDENRAIIEEHLPTIREQAQAVFDETADVLRAADPATNPVKA